MTARKTVEAGAAARERGWAEKMDLIRSRKPLERTLRVWLDDDAKLAVDRAFRGVIAARADVEGATDPTAKAEAVKRLEIAEREHTDAESAADEQAVDITLRGLPRPVYEDLIGEHPPTPEQKEEGHGYDVESFAPALVSACSVDEMPVADATELFQILSQGEAGILFTTALAVCTTGRANLK